jgi:hypothetical protein
MSIVKDNRYSMNCAGYNQSNDSVPPKGKQNNEAAREENALEFEKSIDALASSLGIKFYDRSGKPTQEGMNYSMLAMLKNELYGGNWERMRDDLKDRIKGRPFFFNLVNRIKDDLKRIEKLQEAEKTNQSVVDILVKYNRTASN